MGNCGSKKKYMEGGDVGIMEYMDDMPKKKRMKKSDGTKKYAKGGKVRGTGCATKGLRPCKMV